MILETEKKVHSFIWLTFWFSFKLEDFQIANGNKTGKSDWYQHEHTLILTDYVRKETNLLPL